MPRLSKHPATTPKVITRPFNLSTAQEARPKPARQATGTGTGTGTDTPASAIAQACMQAPPTTTVEPGFICTLCWQAQYEPSKPKLLGTSSRIVCRPCWKAVLDLSICWVCGECIVRGDEVVSLGWCFWHRACFGCLTCGMRMELREFEDGNVGGWGMWDEPDQENCGNGSLSKRKRMVGVELERAPLCPDCEIQIEGRGKRKVVERGLETVSRFDGGLSRDRIDMLSEEKEETRRVSRSKWKRSRFRGSSGLERELKRFINGSASRVSLPAPFVDGTAKKSQWSEFAAADDPEAQKVLIRHAAEMGISENGSIDDVGHHHSDDEMADFGQTKAESPPTIYLSVLNPVSEPAFTPIKTKGLPKWMKFLPNNVYREREREQRRKDSTSVPCSHSHDMEILDGCITSVVDCSPSKNDEETPIPSSSEATPRRLSRASAQLTVVPIDIPNVAKVASQSRATIVIDPKREHAYGNLEDRGDRGSTGNESIYMTPPEYASQLQRRQKTPYSNRRRPMSCNEITPSFSRDIPKNANPKSEEDSCCAFGEEPEPSESPPPGLPLNKTYSNRGFTRLASERITPFVPKSSEYLDKYQLKTAETSYRGYVAKERKPVVEKIQRQQGHKRGREEVAEEMVDKRNTRERSVKLEREEYRFDPRREDLKRELRNLFCEE